MSSNRVPFHYRLVSHVLVSAPLIVPASIGAIYLGASVSLWIPVACLVVLGGVATSYVSRRDRQNALFVFLCIVTFLPAVAGWHVLIPALGVVLLLAANVAHRPSREIFVPHSSPFVVASVVIVSVGVASFQFVSNAVRESSGSLDWRILPGQGYGFLGVLMVVIVASVTNATFEELLWRIGLQRLFVGRRRLITQWLVLSAIFGLSHINGTPGGMVGIAFAGLFGFAMCFIRELSKGSVVWILVAHVVADIFLIGGVYGIVI